MGHEFQDNQIGELPEDIARERGESWEGREKKPTYPPDMAGAKSLQTTRQVLGNVPTNLGVEPSFDVRPINARDISFIRRAELTNSAGADFISSVSYTVPENHIFIGRSIQYITSPLLWFSTVDSTFEYADQDWPKFSLLVNDSPLLDYNLLQLGWGLKYPFDTYFIADQGSTVKLELRQIDTTKFVESRVWVRFRLNGNLLVNTAGLPANLAIANSGGADNKNVQTAGRVK